MRRIQGCLDGIDYHQFYLQADDPEVLLVYPDAQDEISPHGLVAPSGHSVCVSTGISMGAILLTIDLLEAQPDELDTSFGWEAVSDVSFEAGQSTACVRLLGVDTAPPFDAFDLPGEPGWYRVRGHAVGRSLDFDIAVRAAETRERHLLQVWPSAGPLPSVHYRVDDRWEHQ